MIKKWAVTRAVAMKQGPNSVDALLVLLVGMADTRQGRLEGFSAGAGWPAASRTASWANQGNLRLRRTGA